MLLTLFIIAMYEAAFILILGYWYKYDITHPLRLEEN